MQSLLSDLLGPLDLGDFLATYWRKRAYFRPGAAEARDYVERALGGLTAEHLTNRSQVCSAVGEAEGLDRQDDVPPPSALALYARGYTLYLNLLRTIPM